MRAPRLAAAAAALLLAASCAPRPTAVAPVTGGAIEARYLAQLAQREERARMATETATIWPRARGECDTCPLRRLPGVQADLVLAWPERLRMRVDAVFGTALDLSLAGDSLRAYAPAQKAAVLLDAGRDSLGVGDPGGLAVRLLTGAWRPPAAAWSGITVGEGIAVVRWSEGADSVLTAIDERARPAWVELRRGDDPGVRVTYERWEPVEGVAWPATLRASLGGGDFEVQCRLSEVTFSGRPDPARLVARVPAGAERVGLERLRRWLRRLESAR